MPTITTKLLGNTNDADPKPVTGFDYAGQPMKPGAHYNGRPEHMGSNTQSNKTSNKPKRTGKWATREVFLARMRAGRQRKAQQQAQRETEA
jgi:hypothetical protein